MKKSFIILIAMALFISFSSSANAQSASCTASASVVPALSITKLAGVDFGQILSTTPSSGTVSLDPKGSSSTNVGASAKVGEFSITGGNAATVTVTYDASVTLSDASSNQMTLAPDIAGFNAATQSSASTINNGGTITLGSTGNYYIWVGGSLGSLSSQAAGTYQGTFNISVSYN